ncbi:MAG TPA: hypothetical protein VH247_15385 [Thermoleophilaceae bacterium]|jgi:hypothetical protein|nr:hypothetical protein [Thermoleophilaceae bacterium]
MATKADFSEEEWEAIQKGVTGAGMLVSLSDRDFTDSFGEAKALAKFVGGQRNSSDSALIRDIAAVHGSGFGFGTNPQELHDGTTEALRTAVAAISAKAPDDVGAYRELVLGAANHVAEAKGGGTSDQERAAIETITQALGGA